MKFVLVCVFALTSVIRAQGGDNDKSETTTKAGGNSETTKAATKESSIATNANANDCTTSNINTATLADTATETTAAADGNNETSTSATKDNTNGNDWTTANRNTVTLDFSCFSCGRYRTNMNYECKSATSKGLCPEKECWIYTKNDGNRVYVRGCRSNDSTLTNFMCNDFESSTCKTIFGDQVCARCCTSEDCNSGDLEDSDSGELEGSDSGAPTPIGALFIAAAIFVVV